MSSSPSRCRRKSSFFGVHKLAINDNQTMDETKLNHFSSDAVSCTELDQEEIIRNLIAEMRNEILGWKITFGAIKAEYIDAKKQEKDFILDSTRCKNCLTEDDIAYQKAKPMYEEIPSKINQQIDRIAILEHQGNITDIGMGNCLQAAARNVFKIKEQLTHFLLKCDESVSFSGLNDSGNCSMESIKSTTSL